MVKLLVIVMKMQISLITIALTSAFGIALARGAPSPNVQINSEINVTLFGQPCLLSGPFEKEVLKTIHAISPEQTFVDPTIFVAQPYQKVLEKIRAAKGVPAYLENYRDHKIKRLDAQSAFVTALGAAKNAQKAETLITTANRFIPAAKQKNFAKLAKGLLAKKTGESSSAQDSQLLDSFNEMIEPDPEDEFHRANRKINVNYSCDFAEEGEDEESGG